MSKNVALTTLNCSKNPNLKCIQALNTQVKTYWTKDATATYSETCTTALTENEIPTPKPSPKSTLSMGKK